MNLARLGAYGISGGDLGFGTANGMRMDADAESFAYKYFPRTTSPIVSVDPYIDMNGTVTGINFRIEVQSTSADAPSGTVLGAATAEWAGPAADGFIGDKTLATDTGALTLGTPVWIRVYRSSGSALSASNYIQPASSAFRPSQDKVRHHNGTNWTTTSPLLALGAVVITHANGEKYGSPVTVGNANSAQADIFDTNRLGLRVMYSTEKLVHGVSFRAVKAGTPENLEVLFYIGRQLMDSVSVIAAEIESNIDSTVWFRKAPSIRLPPFTYGYYVFRQAGVSGTNDYDIRTWAVAATRLEMLISSTHRFIAGTGDDPTALSVIDTEVPMIFPIAEDFYEDFRERRPLPRTRPLRRTA